jgi:hypothetical protein
MSAYCLDTNPYHKLSKLTIKIKPISHGSCRFELRSCNILQDEQNCNTNNSIYTYVMRHMAHDPIIANFIDLENEMNLSYIYISVLH